MPCCNEISPLGCFTSCDSEIDTGLVADVTGDWSFEAEFAGSIVKKSFAAVATETIKLPAVFNEDYTTILRIYKPDGTQYGGVCYSFTVTPKIAI